MNEQIKLEKQMLRTSLRALTQSLPDAYIERSDRGIRETLLSLPQWNGARAVFIYAGIGREVDTGRIIRAALDAGKTVALPRCLTGGKMEALMITSLDALKPGRFGIPEPDASSRILRPQAVELAVVPCVAADRQGYRLGYGGGYYDRYLEGLSLKTVCLCRERLLQEFLPHDDFDRPVNIVVTEDNEIVCR